MLCTHPPSNTMARVHPAPTSDGPAVNSATLAWWVSFKSAWVCAIARCLNSLTRLRTPISLNNLVLWRLIVLSAKTKQLSHLRVAQASRRMIQDLLLSHCEGSLASYWHHRFLPCQ